MEPPGTSWIRSVLSKLWFELYICSSYKVDVNGSGAHPLFAYLKTAQPGFLINAIKWNFTKFLINREGKAVARFELDSIFGHQNVR